MSNAPGPAAPPPAGAAGLLCAALLGLAITFSLFYGTSFFRDMAIVFEGGYRISEGQLPFRDFFVPGGLTAFYLQALSIWLVGATALSMPVHAGALAAIVAALTYRLARLDLGPAFSLLLAGFMVVSLNGVFGSPHYGFVAYFFFDIACLLLLCRPGTPVGVRSLMFLALLGAASIYAKQDLLATVPLIALYLWFSGAAPFIRVCLAYLLPFVVMLVVAAALFQLSGDFLYWFHHGQAPHHSRLPALADLAATGLGDWRAWVSLAALLALFKWRGQRAALLAVLLVALPPLLLTQTSGLEEQTRLQGAPLLLLLLYRLAPTRAPYRRLAKPALALALFVFVTPVAVLVSLDVNLAKALDRPSFSGVGDDDVRIAEGAYRGVLTRTAAARDLARIQVLVRQNAGDVVNMSSLAFLYAETGRAPPVGLPLWFDQGITFFDAQWPMLTAELVARRPALILLQDAHDHGQAATHAGLRDYYLANGYELDVTAAAPRSDAPILVLRRKP